MHIPSIISVSFNLSIHTFKLSFIGVIQVFSGQYSKQLPLYITGQLLHSNQCKFL